jgi:hypothetical protein
MIIPLFELFIDNLESEGRWGENDITIDKGQSD